MTDARPYPQVAAALWKAGYSPLPLPEGAKAPPPEGWTGSGPMASYADVAAWAEDPRHVNGNIAVRVPANVVALDVDAYGGKPGGVTWAELVERLGAPPATVVVSARTDGLSGIRLFRLPDGVADSELAGGLAGIDVIRFGHRYVVAPGSLHPTLGTVYACWDEGTGEVLDSLPPVGSLPTLPLPWVEAFSKGKKAADKAGDRHPALTAGKPCQALLRALSEGLEALGSGASRHDTMVASVARLARLGEQGHAGAGRALGELRAAFVEAVAQPREGSKVGVRTTPDALREFAAAVDSGIELVEADPTPEDKRGCCAPPGIGASLAEHLGTVSPAPGPANEPDAEQDSRRGYLDWPALWANEDAGREFLIPGVWTRGAGGSIYSPAGAGKSLLGLEWSACLALGLPILGEPVEPRTVLYIDLENDEHLVRERLEALGLAGRNIPRLHYSLLGDWAPLDTAQGGRELIDEAHRLAADLVLIDTTARVISGEENNADTFHALYRFALKPLKAAGIASVRLDHAGKDLTRGERGSSAKRGDVDLTYRLTLTGEATVSLKREKNRLHLPGPEILMLRRATDPLRHVPLAVDLARERRLTQLVETLDRLGVPADAGRPTARKVLKDGGEKATDRDLAVAQARRRLNSPELGCANPPTTWGGVFAHSAAKSASHRNAQPTNGPRTAPAQLCEDPSEDPQNGHSHSRRTVAPPRSGVSPEPFCLTCGLPMPYGDLNGDGRRHPNCGAIS